MWTVSIVCCHLEQVLDVPEVFSRQVVVLQAVEDGLGPLRRVLAAAGLQPVLVEAAPEERLGQLAQVALDDGREDVVVRGLQGQQPGQPGRLQLSLQPLDLAAARRQPEQSLLLDTQRHQSGHTHLAQVL